MFLVIFNTMLKTGYMPQSLSQTAIVPVFKKGDPNNARNYRGISLISNLTKLFTSVLNNRLLTWIEENNILTHSQFGTVDANFVLNTLVKHSLLRKHILYCCFNDYKKAFDSINIETLCGIKLPRRYPR